jgi:hypothetical protein
VQRYTIFLNRKEINELNELKDINNIKKPAQM